MFNLDFAEPGQNTESKTGVESEQKGGNWNFSNRHWNIRRRISGRVYARRRTLLINRPRHVTERSDYERVVRRPCRAEKDDKSDRG